jgi:hypothetical protein
MHLPNCLAMLHRKRLTLITAMAAAAAVVANSTGWASDADGVAWTATIDKAMWGKFGFQYPVTYVFHLADVPRNLEI